MVRLDQVLDSWKTVRADTINAVNDFPAGEFDFRLTPELMTFGEVARHILDASDGLTGLLLAGEENFAAPDFREKLKPHLRAVDPGPAGLAAAMRDSIEERTAQLAARPAGFYSRIIAGRGGQSLTRLEMLQFVKEHELTHRAQLFLYMRVKGLVPATTRRRMAKQATSQK
ncbi:MAG TPA: DinB family protein [Bryobacteraceae bacterium]|nr:DinB family protein [Bryobacteraceae bacterium]